MATKIFYIPITVLFVLFNSLTAARAQNSILWEISGNSLLHPSYMLGTLKFIEKKEYFIPPLVKKYIQESDVFVTEDKVDSRTQYELNKAIHFPKGKSLITKLSPEDYIKIKTIFKDKFKINTRKFNRKYAKMTPLSLSIAITRLLLHQDIRFYDLEILKIAQKNDLKIHTLESIDREIYALHAFPMTKQISVLLHTINNLKEQKSNFKKLEHAYTQNNLEDIFKCSLRLFENNPVFMEEFYFKRNQEWIPKIEKMLKNKKIFITVGVLHLKGERGLISLLKDKGYTLTPLPLTK